MSNGHTAVAELLLKSGADPNHQEGDGWNALMLASAERSHNCGRAVSQIRCRTPNHQMKMEWNALNASKCEMVTQLWQSCFLKSGADPRTIKKDMDGPTCFNDSKSVNGHRGVAELLLLEYRVLNSNN